MRLETTPWDAADHLESTDAILGNFEAAFENGDPGLIAAALNDVARAGGLEQDPLSAGSHVAAVIRTLKSLGFELTAKAA